MKLKRNSVIIVVCLALLLAVIASGVVWYGGNPREEYPFQDTTWKLVRGDDSQWQKNQKNWINLSFRVPEATRIEEVFTIDSDNLHHLDVSLSDIVPSSYLSVTPLAQVFSKGGDISVIATTLQGVEFGGFSEEFSHRYSSKEFLHTKGIQFDPITFEGSPDSLWDISIPTYLLMKTRLDMKTDEYSIYRFSLQYDNSINDMQIRKLEQMYTQILDSVQAL